MCGRLSSPGASAPRNSDWFYVLRLARHNSDRDASSEASRGITGRCGLLFKLEDSLHQQPFFAGLGLGNQRLNFPHHLSPSAHSYFSPAAICFGSKKKPSVSHHNHEHARPEKLDFMSSMPDALMLLSISGQICLW